MIATSIVHQVLSFISVFLAGMSIGMSIIGLLHASDKRSAKKPVKNRDDETSRSDK